MNKIKSKIIIIIVFCLFPAIAWAVTLKEYSYNDIKGVYEGITYIVSPTYFYLRINEQGKCTVAFATYDSEPIQNFTFSITSIEKAMERNKCILDVDNPKLSQMSLSVLSPHSLEIKVPMKINEKTTIELPIVLMRTDFTEKIKNHITKQLSGL